MTEKENFMMLVRGEVPEWVPRYAFSPDPSGKPVPNAMVMPSVLSGHIFEPGPQKDIWGVTYVPVREAGGAKLPEPNNFILKDIRKWRDVIKAPDLSGIDWEATAKKDLEKLKVDRRDTALGFSLHIGYFQNLMAFMGFSEGLCAMYEEPDEVMALFQYMADFFVKVTKKMIEYYKPDIMELTDDTATARNPFVSLEMYREMIKPYHYMQNKPAIDAGIPIAHHNCGRCEDQIDDWLEIGIVAWNPAQVMNDLDGIKKKYGKKLGLIGCWDSSGPAGWDDATEDLIKSEVRKTIDRFAPDGGFCFWGSAYGPLGDPRVENRKRWLTEEYEAYGRTFYSK
jgi:hypothetical protein